MFSEDQSPNCNSAYTPVQAGKIPLARQLCRWPMMVALSVAGLAGAPTVHAEAVAPEVPPQAASTAHRMMDGAHHGASGQMPHRASGTVPHAGSSPPPAADPLQWQSGGVTTDERHLMKAHAARYSLWLVTAMRNSGEYLSDVHVSIRDASGVLLFDQLLEGPWLLIELPPGRYEVVATSDGQRLTRDVRIPKVAKRTAPERVYLHFPPR